MKQVGSLIVVLSSIVLWQGCVSNAEDLFDDKVRHQLWLSHLGADLPITIEGNTASKTFCILVHGGPGGSAQEFNAFTKTFSDKIEDKYAMVYYDQRAAGISRGEYDPLLNTVVQHIEDLDQVISLLYEHYGDDIDIALMGHSWGGYLTCAYLLDPDRASSVDVWVNIDGGIHRTNFLKDDMRRIIDIANEEIIAGVMLTEWTELRNRAQSELNRNVVAYNAESQQTPFVILSEAEEVISETSRISTVVNSTFNAVYLNNYQPFIASGNDFRDGSLVQQDMFDFDATVEAQISNITLPTLNVYGYWDVRTALHQGEYVMDSISTPVLDKSLVILPNSGHSPMVNEPIELAETILDWLELYL